MSRARDLADAGSKANFLDNVTADIDTTYAPKASPTFTGNVGLGSNANGNFNGSISSSATFPAGHILQVQYMSTSSPMNSTGSYVQLLNGAYITITKIAGSNIFLSWSSQMGKTNSNVYTHGSKIERATNTAFSQNLTAIPASPQVAATEEPDGSVGFNNASQYNYTGNWGHTTIDEGITSSAGTYYYRVQWKSQGTTVTSAIDAGVSTFYAMEVKA